MQFILIAHDKAGGLPLRKATRPAHLAYWQDLVGPKVLYGGPLLGADGNPNGSVLIIEAEDEAAAKAAFGADPYISLLRYSRIRRLRRSGPCFAMGWCWGELLAGEVRAGCVLLGAAWWRTEVEPWTGVRNHSAKLNLKAMRKGDLAYFFITRILARRLLGL